MTHTIQELLPEAIEGLRLTPEMRDQLLEALNRYDKPAGIIMPEISADYSEKDWQSDFRFWAD